MNKPEAIVLLKGYLSELDHLQKLSWNNNEKRLWRNKVDVVIEDAFGNLSSEYHKIHPPAAIFDEEYYIEEVRQQKYLENLQRYRTALLSIIQKYEILGVEEKSDAISEPVKTSEKGKTIWQNIWHELKDFIAAIIAKFMAEKTK